MNDTTVRNADLVRLAAMLTEQHARKIDVVAPSGDVRFADGELMLDGIAPLIEGDGVTQVDGVYELQDVFIEGLASKLNIPLAYLRRIHQTRVDLFDANVNGWLQGVDGGDPDKRSFLLRLFRGQDGPGIARALLSSSYRTIDNVDVMTAVIKGVSDADVDVQIAGCDLSEKRMHIRLVCPQIAVAARETMKGYRSPYSGQTGEDMPLVFAGFVAQNSELGAGAFSLTPRAVFQACNNGLTVQADAFREVHLGGQMDDGVVQWSDETKQKSLELITSRTRDAVRTFLSEKYLEQLIAAIDDKAGHQLAVPATAIEVVSKKLGFTEEQRDGILDAFLRGAQPTAGGVMQAVTAYAQTVDDPDKAAALEGQALAALSEAARL